MVFNSYLLERYNFVYNWSYALNEICVEKLYIIKMFIIMESDLTKTLI